MFLHKIVSDKNIIIDDNTNFSYNEHLNMAKKIIELSKADIKNILKIKKKPKNVFPSIDFIFQMKNKKKIISIQAISVILKAIPIKFQILL